MIIDVFVNIWKCDSFVSCM